MSTRVFASSRLGAWRGRTVRIDLLTSHGTVLVAIDSLILVRRVGVERLAAVISDATSDPARHASDAELLAPTVIEQFVRFRRQLPVHPSSPDQNPSTVRLTSPKCHPDRQPQHGKKCHQPSTIDLARDDATAHLRAPMVAAGHGFRKIPFSRFGKHSSVA